MKSSNNGCDEEVQAPVIPPPETKRSRLHIWHVVTAILVLIIVAQAIFYVPSITLQSKYNRLRYQINQRSLYYNASDFITPNDSAVEQIVTEITDGWSDASNWNEFWVDVKAMYDWVVDNIEYRHDGLFPVLPADLSEDAQYNNEMWQFPNETLSLRRGDCEDMSILLCSMILRYGGEQCWAECITIIGSKGGHMGVQVLVTKDKLTILDPAGRYYTSNGQENIANEDVSTEINNWLSRWKPELGSGAYISMVFSNDLDETFSSTSEYLLWMSAR